MMLYLGLGLLALLGLGLGVRQEFAFKRRLADMAREVRERENG